MGLTIAAGLIAAGAALGFAGEVTVGEVTGTDLATSPWKGPDSGNAPAFWLTADMRVTESAGAGRLQPADPFEQTDGWATGLYASPLGLSVWLAQMADSRPQVGDAAMVAGLDGPGARLPLRDGPSREATALARLPNGTPVIVIGEQDPWLRVVTGDGEVGWVRGGFVVPTGESDSMAPTEDLRWTHWNNARFGMTIDFPATLFRPEPAPANGDGQSFVTDEGRAGFFVFGQWNALNLDPRGMHGMDLDTGVFGTVTQDRLTADGYVIEGQNEGNITYRRAMMPAPGDVLYVFEISYPAAEAAHFGPVVERMASSFRITSDDAHDAAVPDPSQETGQDGLRELLDAQLRRLREGLP